MFDRVEKHLWFKQNINLDKNYKPLIKIRVRDLMSEFSKCDPIVRVRVLIYLCFVLLT